MRRKVALYDMDYTVFKGDSMFKLLFYGIRKKPILFFRLPVVVLYVVGYFMEIVSLIDVKEQIFIPMRYLTEDELRDFFERKILKRIYPTAKKSLKEHRENGDYILLVTASPYAYAKYFKEFGYVDEVIGTNLEKTEKGYSNIVDGMNCKGDEKVERIKKCLKDADIQIDFEKSCGYSDSKSDIPMLKMVRNRYKVDKVSGKIKEFVF